VTDPVLIMLALTGLVLLCMIAFQLWRLHLLQEAENQRVIDNPIFYADVEVARSPMVDARRLELAELCGQAAEAHVAFWQNRERQERGVGRHRHLGTRDPRLEALLTTTLPFDPIRPALPAGSPAVELPMVRTVRPATQLTLDLAVAT